MRALRGITECHVSIALRCGTLWNVVEMLWGVVGRYGTLQSVVWRYGSIIQLLRNVMQPLGKISILSIT